MSTKVPAAPISHAIRLYRDENPDITDEQFMEMSGMKHTTLNNLLESKTQVIDFSIADRALCAIGRVQLWMSEALREAYYAVDLLRYEPWELELLATEAVAA